MHLIIKKEYIYTNILKYAEKYDILSYRYKERKMDSKQELFEKIPIPKALCSLAVPTIISQLVNLVYSIVDTFFIGRTGNSYMMASVTLAFTIFMMTIALSNLFGVGGGSLIARLQGKHDNENAKKVCAFSVYGSLGIAIFYSLVIAVFLKPILYLFGASSNTIGYAIQYVTVVCIIGNVPMILSMCLSHLLRNAGYSRYASVGLSGGGILNIILDPILMFAVLPKGYEVLGAALATMLSNVFSCVFLLICTYKASKGSPLTANPKYLKGIRRQDIKALFSVGVPSAMLTGLFDIANIFLNKLMANHGDLELAAIGIVMKAERLPNAINIGLCQGMLPLVAYNYSSGDRNRMKKAISVARYAGMIISLLSVIFFEIFRENIIKLFMNAGVGNIQDAVNTIEFATVFLAIRALASPMQFINYHSSFCLQAMGNGMKTLIHALVREAVFYIPLMYIMNSLFGINGLVGALVAGELFGGIFALWMLKLSTKQQKNEI